MNDKDLTFMIITWNMGKSLKKITNWEVELKKWAIIDPRKDIICFTIQEASRECGSKLFPKALEGVLPGHHIITEGNGTVIPGLNFHVYGYVCIKKDIKKDIINELAPGTANVAISKTMCIHKQAICTKPSIGIGINLDCIKLLFVGSHFPIDVKDKETFGYTGRIDAIKKISTDLIQPLTKKLGEGHITIFWAGDMNFRIQSKKSNDIEQLSCFMSGCANQTPNHMCKDLLSPKILSKCSHIQDFVESPRDPSYNKSCRYKEYDEKTNKEIDFISLRLSESEDSEMKYDDRRIPSYCDRIIYQGDVKVDSYTSWPPHADDGSIYPLSIYPLSILYSDHEPVCMSGTIKCPSFKQVGGFMQKYTVAKSKYHKLRKIAANLEIVKF